MPDAPTSELAGASAAGGRLPLTRLADSLNAAIEVSAERRRA